MTGDRVLIDGCRSKYELAHFKESLSDIVTVGIDAPEEMRYQRLVSRGRDDSPATYEEFKSRDQREVGWGAAEAVANADIRLVNDSSLEEFRSRCNEIVRDLTAREKSI